MVPQHLGTVGLQGDRHFSVAVTETGRIGQHVDSQQQILRTSQNIHKKETIHKQVHRHWDPFTFTNTCTVQAHTNVLICFDCSLLASRSACPACENALYIDPTRGRNISSPASFSNSACPASDPPVSWWSCVHTHSCAAWKTLSHGTPDAPPWQANCCRTLKAKASSVS